MNDRPYWFRKVSMVLLPLLLLGVVFVPVAAAGVDDSESSSRETMAQSEEYWRYRWDGAGGYELIGWNPTEVAIFINGMGFDRTRIGIAVLDIASGNELWSMASDQLDGFPENGITTPSGLVIVATSRSVYAFDETLGDLVWSTSHGFDWAPEIVADEHGVVVLAYDDAVLGIDEASGDLLWQQTVPLGRVADWYSISDGPLVGLGRPEFAGQDVIAFGIDIVTGAIVWQTSVGGTVASTGGELELAGNRSGTIAVAVSTDGTTALSVLNGFTGGMVWTVPLSNDNLFTRLFVTNGPQPTVVHTEGTALDDKTATGYDAVAGTIRWQNQSIGIDTILVDEIQLIGAGPVLNAPNALVAVDGESGATMWSQPYALIDGGFWMAAQTFIEQVIFTPAVQEMRAPAVLSVDTASGDIGWEATFAEYDAVYLAGLPAGVVLVTATDSAGGTLIAFGS